MIKKTFTAAEAAKWLVARVGEAVNEHDVIRAAAEGRLHVCFDYRGNVAVYPRPDAVPSMSWIFPKAISKHYFVGLLRSKSPVQLGTRVESLSLRPGPGGQPIRCASVDYVDILQPNHVEVATLVHGDPTLSAVDSNRFVARCDQHGAVQYTQVPRSKWIFHIDDLLALVASQGAAATTPSAQEPNYASPQGAAVTNGENWEAVARELAQKVGEEKWRAGIREITARNVADAVATRLASIDAPKYWGNRGARSASTVRNEALAGWKFSLPEDVA